MPCLLAVLPWLVLSACDNVARAWDPDKGGGGGGGGGGDPATELQVPPEGGITRSGKPQVVFAGGDGVTGPDLVVTAMIAGRKAAQGIRRGNSTPPCHPDC